MELMQLEMFVAVAEERSFLGAAERVFRTQPAVSLGLRKLEERIGVPLIDRSTRRSGRLTHLPAKSSTNMRPRILGLRDKAISAVKSQRSPTKGNLRIGVASGSNFDWIPQVTRRFNSACPDIRLEITYDHSVRLFQELTARRLDLVLLSGRAKGEAKSKNWVITRQRGTRPFQAFWVVRRRHRSSSPACAFEEKLIEHCHSARGTLDARQSEPRAISIAKIALRKPVLRVGNAS